MKCMQELKKHDENQKNRFFLTSNDVICIMNIVQFCVKHMVCIEQKFKQRRKQYETLYKYIIVLRHFGDGWRETYREFTKFNEFTEKTTLGVVHTHYFVLGMLFFLLLLLFGKEFCFYHCKNETDALDLPYRIESDRRYVCRGGITVFGSAAFLGCKCGDFWHSRDWSYFTWRQSDTYLSTD